MALSRRERQRKIREIYRDMEAKKRELGLRAPVIKRGPVFYFAMLMVLLMVGGALIQAAGKGGGRSVGDGRFRRAQSSVDAVAEALGRWKFHIGAYPSLDEGLVALAEKRSVHAGWIGPYLSKIVEDPWHHPYVYELDDKGNAVVLSLGPDGKRGTADDIVPDPALFTKPFRDTTWTNDWAPFTQRGIIVVPSKK